MRHHFSSIFGCLAAGLGIGCLGASSGDDVVENVGVTTAALSVCDETVPANRNVDGFPAYAQCSASNDAAIYSNNGIDTSTTQTTKDWIRTQYSGGYQCTEFAHRYLYFKWGVKWIPNGNAGTWCDTQPPANSGIVQTMAPVHGDIMVLAPGSCGADGTTGHVNIVDQVSGTKLTNVEQNGARRGNYMLSCGKCFLHVMANDGSGTPASGAAGAPASSGPGVAGSAAPAAPSDGRPRRPSMGYPQMAAAGAGAPVSNAGAAGSGAAGSRPAVAPTAPAPTSTPLVNNSAAAGSSALTGAVTSAPATSSGAPVDAGCSIAAVGGKRSADMPLTLGLSLLAGMVLRSRRRRSQ